MIHGTSQYKKDENVVHTDLCPPNCCETDSPEWRHRLHTALDEMLDQGNGDGFFLLKKENFTMDEDLTEQDLVCLAKIQAKVNHSLQKRSLAISGDYLNKKEATYISQLETSVAAGVKATLETFAFLETVPRGSYDSDLKQCRAKIYKAIEEKFTSFNSKLTRAKDLLCREK